jgi:hypothetical protein
MFLSIHYESDSKDPFVHVVISSNQFSNLPVEKRVALVYKKIFEDKGELISVLPVIVETFSSKEMVEVFEYIK